MAEKKRVRRSPDARRSEIVDAACGLYLERNYLDVGLAEVAAAGSVSRPLLYRYFPAGRSDVFVAVVEALVDELHDRLRHAARAPFSSAKRMEHLLAAFFAFFTDHPTAYRVLVQDVWAVRDPEVAAAAQSARARLVGEIAHVVAAGGGSADHVLLLSTGIFGCALANVELAMADAVDTEVAWKITCAFATSQLS